MNLVNDVSGCSLSKSSDNLQRNIMSYMELEERKECLVNSFECGVCSYRFIYAPLSS